MQKAPAVLGAVFVGVGDGNLAGGWWRMAVRLVLGVLKLQLLWARRMAFVRTKSNTSVKTAYVRKSNYGRSYSAV